MAYRIAAGVLSVVLALGCGGGKSSNPDGGPGRVGTPDGGPLPDGGPRPGGSDATVTGSVGGYSLTPVSSFGVSTAANCPRASFSFAVVGIADFSASCTALQSQAEKAGSTTLTLLVARASTVSTQPPQPIAAGTYMVRQNPLAEPSGSQLFVEAVFDKLDANCQSLIRQSAGVATGGTIVINSIGTTVSGTFDLTFASAERLSGTFNSPVCAVPASVLCDNGADGGSVSTCQR